MNARNESSANRARWRAVSLILLLGFALALRLVGPSAGLPARDGYVAICAGGQIAYIPISQTGTDPSPDNSGKPTSERCPWFFQFHAIAAAPPSADFRPVAIAAAPLRVSGSPASPQQSSLPFQARAPPAGSIEADLQT